MTKYVPPGKGEGNWFLFSKCVQEMLLNYFTSANFSVSWDCWTTNNNNIIKPVCSKMIIGNLAGKLPDMDKAVTKVMNVEMAIITNVSPSYYKFLDYLECSIYWNITYARLGNHPGKAQEKHNAPNAHHVADEHSFDPSEFNSLDWSFLNFFLGILVGLFVVKTEHCLVYTFEFTVITSSSLLLGSYNSWREGLVVILTWYCVR